MHLWVQVRGIEFRVAVEGAVQYLTVGAGVGRVRFPTVKVRVWVPVRIQERFKVRVRVRLQNIKCRCGGIPEDCLGKGCTHGLSEEF